jgi:hypothetical protein
MNPMLANPRAALQSVVVVLGLLNAACGSPAAGGAATDPSAGAADEVAAEATSAPSKALQELQELLMSVRPPLTDDQADAVARAAMKGAGDTARLKLAMEFARRNETDGVNDGSTGDDRLGNELTYFYYAMPRDLQKPSGTGQAYVETFPPPASDSDFLDNVTLHVFGTAKVDYKLTFQLAETKVSVSIAKGTTQEATATLVDTAIAAKSPQIVAKATFGSVGGLHADSASFGPSDVDEVFSDVKDHELHISPDLTSADFVMQ